MRDDAATREEDEHGIASGTIVGAFRLIERIGQGGMGDVYRAERVAGDFTQQVAIKVIAARLQGAGTIHRFRTERQILASLQHPNIVTLIDGGVTSAGHPYLVMELVDGMPHHRLLRPARTHASRSPRRFQASPCRRRARAQPPDRPPGSQAGERARHAERPGEGARLRRRQAARIARSRGIRHGVAPRPDDAELREPRAASWTSAHDILRRLLTRRSAVRDRDRETAVRDRRLRSRRDRADRPRGGAAASEPGRLECAALRREAAQGRHRRDRLDRDGQGARRAGTTPRASSTTS